MHKFLCTHNTACVHIMGMVITVQAICEGLGSKTSLDSDKLSLLLLLLLLLLLKVCSTK